KREKLKQDLRELREALPEIEASRDEFALALESTEAVLERAKAAVRQSEAGVAQARDAARAAALRERSGELAGKIGAVEGARKALLDLQAEKDAGRFPSLTGIRAIREAFSRLERAKIHLDASRVALEITSDDTFTGSVETEEGEEPLTLAAGKAVRLEGAPEVRARIEGLGLIRAFSPLESALEAAEAVEAARGELKKLTEPFGGAEQSRLEELYEKGLSLDGRIEKERAGLNALLGGESEDTLSGRAEEIEGELQGIFEKYPAWKGAFPDPAELEASAAEQKRAADEEARRAEEDRNVAVKAHAEKDLRLKVAEEKLKGEQKGLESLEESLRKLRDDGLTEKERAEALADSALAWDKAKVLAEEFAKQLAEYGADPAGELKKTSEALERKAAEFETTEKEHIRERARLETWSARGLYTTASDLEEKLSQLEDDHKREKLAADSTKLLRDVFAACRSEMAGAVNRAASARATEIFARIAGREGGRLLLAESMKPSGFVPGGMDGDVGIEPLSGGEKEQLHFAVRMALAECCSSKEERELLVLDDILMATDGIRFPRILEIIEDASECLQVLILTCQPERFASIEKANRIDLQALTAGKGEE
ncbi:MAG: hypothetical protein GX843_08885, partial [Synergistaceae bacterium]|nr:hypothetical protein [Synergistaceae bacterium]